MKRPNFSILYLLFFAVLSITGCGGNPSKANIELRKELQATQQQNADLKLQHESDLATISSLKERQNVVATLPEDRVGKLFTTHGIVFSRLTTADQKMLKVYVTPTDDQAQRLKAAGAIVVEAFDLARPDNQRIGEWQFTTEEAKSKWNGEMMLYAYVLECPWQNAPGSSNVTVKVTFTDELTGRAFTAQRQLTPSPLAGEGRGEG
jgi:hypothetical protein